VIELHESVVREVSRYGGYCVADVEPDEANYQSPTCRGFLPIGEPVIRSTRTGYRWCVPCGENAWNAARFKR